MLLLEIILETTLYYPDEDIRKIQSLEVKIITSIHAVAI